MSVNLKTVEMCEERALAQTAEVIRDLMGPTLIDFERSRSNKFKLVITVCGTLKSGRGSFDLHTTAKSSIGLNQEAYTDHDDIDFGGPNLFQVAEQHGAKVSIEVKDTK